MEIVFVQQNVRILAVFDIRCLMLADRSISAEVKSLTVAENREGGRGIKEYFWFPADRLSKRSSANNNNNNNNRTSRRGARLL